MCLAQSVAHNKYLEDVCVELVLNKYTLILHTIALLITFIIKIINYLNGSLQDIVNKKNSRRCYHRHPNPTGPAAWGKKSIFICYTVYHSDFKQRGLKSSLEEYCMHKVTLWDGDQDIKMFP